MLHANPQTIVVAILGVIAGALSVPVLYRGFVRRGTGVHYEQDFLIQRAPQYMSLLNIAFFILAFFTFDGMVTLPFAVPVLALTNTNPTGILAIMSWTGVAIFVSGLIFMIGGWYSLGDLFTTDAEVLEGHQVRNDGLLNYVMHPAYSGIIQSVLGASLAATSITGALFAILVVAPLWLRRAKYEEQILIQSLGQDYKNYAETMKWRRLVPRFLPFGV